MLRMVASFLVVLALIALTLSCESRLNVNASDQLVQNVEEPPTVENTVENKGAIETTGDETPNTANNSKLTLSLTGSPVLNSHCEFTQTGTVAAEGDAVYKSASASVSSLGSSSGSATDLGFSVSMDQSILDSATTFSVEWKAEDQGGSFFTKEKEYSLSLTDYGFPLELATSTSPSVGGQQVVGSNCVNGAGSLTVGKQHGCVLGDDGIPLCWGRQTYGATGSGTSLMEVGFIDGIDGTAGNTATHVATGGWSACAVIDNGSVRCWGEDFNGEMGQGAAFNGQTYGALTVPHFDLTAGKTATDIAGGFWGAYCVITDLQTVKCWGRLYGATPVQITGIDGSVDSQRAVKIAVGIKHGCALMVDESIKCWGYNGEGELGNGNNTNSAGAAQPVSGLDGSAGNEALAVTAGEYSSCALMKDETVKCWGKNASGHLGNGEATGFTTNVPVPVNFFDGTAGKKAVELSLSQGAGFCGKTDAGSWYCWGLSGSVGDGTYEAVLEPRANPNFDGTAGKDAAMIAAGWVHGCALYSDGKVGCFGAFSRIFHIDVGSLDPGLLSDFDGTAGKTAVKISSTDGGTCMITDDGRVGCVGYPNLYGKAIPYTAPERVANIGSTLPKAKQLFSRFGDYDDGACAILADDSLACWGADRYGMGITGVFATPTPMVMPDFDGSETTKKVISMGGTIYSSCAVMKSGALNCWGWNRRGNMSFPDSGTRYIPEESPVFDGSSPEKSVVAISTGANTQHTCVVLQTGAVNCFGRGQNERLGFVGAAAYWNPTPTEVIGLDGSSITAKAVAVDVGGAFSCALIADGTVRCWGYDGYGQLGNGATTTADQSTPVEASGIDGTLGNKAVQISLGANTGCALLDSGAVRCWGLGTSGQIGNQADASSAVPVTLPDIDGTAGKKAVVIASGLSSSCALMEDKYVKCWGVSTTGVLGNDATAPAFFSTPVNILDEGESNGGNPFSSSEVATKIIGL